MSEKTNATEQTAGVASYMKPIAGKAYYEKWLEIDKGVTSDD